MENSSIESTSNINSISDLKQSSDIQIVLPKEIFDKIKEMISTYDSKIQSESTSQETQLIWVNFGKLSMNVLKMMLNNAI